LRIASWASQFSAREVKKQYIALVHGFLKERAAPIRNIISRGPLSGAPA